MPDTGNAKDCLESPPTFFSIFTFKNLTWRTYLISFCLYRACFTHLISSNLSWNLCLWYYDQLVNFDKEINANVCRHSLWEYCRRFHSSFEWHLTPHMTLSIENCIRRTPCIKRTLHHSRGCPLNTGFTVINTLRFNDVTATRTSLFSTHLLCQM